MAKYIKINKKYSIMLIIIGIILILIIGYFLINTLKAKELEKINVKLGWLHQAQFAGMYVAQEKGFYADEGLDVDLIPLSFEKPTIDVVVNGESVFGVTGAEQIIMEREKGVPIKAIAVIYKITPDCVYALKDSQISTPKDLVGKTVGIREGITGEVLYAVMIKRFGIDRSKINEIKIGYGVEDIINGRVDAETCYTINEPYQIIERGYEVNIILSAELETNMYGDVLFVREDTIENNPELVERFLRATLKGWEYAMKNKNRKESIDIVLKYATERTRAHEFYMLENSIPLINVGELPLGWMEKSEWERAQNILLESRVINKTINIEDAYTMEFLEKIYN